MKAIPCKLFINSSRGFVFAPMEFPSVRQAVKYARREYAAGFAWRLFSMDGRLIRRGFCVI